MRVLDRPTGFDTGAGSRCAKLWHWMTAQHGVMLAACVGELSLALLAIRRVGRTPLGIPLALLCLDLFAFQFADFAFQRSGAEGWRWLDAALSPFAAPLALQFLLAFVGRLRASRPLLGVTYGLFAGLASIPLAAFVSPAAAAVAASNGWIISYLILLGLSVLWMLGLLWRHLRRSTEGPERVRTQALLLSLGVVAAFASTDLLAGLGLGVPRLGSLGGLAATFILSGLVVRFELFGRPLAPLKVAYAVALGSAALIAHLLVFRFFSSNVAVTLAAASSVSLACAGFVRKVVLKQALETARLQHMAVLGRFSAQMAHDLRNPIAALHGALQFLQEERNQGRSLDDHSSFLDLMGSQVERLREVTDRYNRLSRVELTRVQTPINALVEPLLARQRLAARAEVKVTSELSEGLPELMLDRELLTGALENLAQNALEAITGPGKLMLRTRRWEAGAASGVEIEVEDSGSGMDARTRERALEDFFTTKVTGSGLGLAFVRRVVEAHGGQLELLSESGRGTLVRLRLPQT